MISTKKKVLIQNWSVLEEILKCSVYLFGNTIQYNQQQTNDDVSFEIA